MTRSKILILTVVSLAVAAIVVSAASDTTKYRLNGKIYQVPHEYEFERQFRIFWLEGIKGLPEEPEESLWLLMPAAELDRDVIGYERNFRGYVGKNPADIVVNVLGGREARNFQADRERIMGMVSDNIREGAKSQNDPATGWDRVIYSDGIAGTPAQGHLSFHLMPKADQKQLPMDWIPPSCLASPDSEGRETYYCNFQIHRSELTFRFSLREENLGVADSIPAYITSRLDGWLR